jgi:F0F1-type ATP synthase membrane subunit b/b'
MLSLDQVYLLSQQVQHEKPHLNETLKTLLDNSKAQISQERNNYKDSLNYLKTNYLAI